MGFRNNRILIVYLAITSFILLITHPLFAQNIEWQKYGYAKYLFSISKDVLGHKDQLTDHQIHIRLNNRLYFNTYYTLGLEFRLRGFSGSSVKESIQTPEMVITPYPYNDLDVLFWKNSNNFAYGQVDRFFLDYSKEDWQVTLGRQRIAWGTSLVWNVTDLFNPQSVLDFDYEEKPGSDALRIQYFTGVVGRLECVLKPAPGKYDRTIALLYLINKWDYDFYFITAWHQDKPLLGAAFAGDIAGAGFRGELKVTRKPTKEQLGNTLLPPPFINLSDANVPDVSAVLSLDYTFPSSLYLHGELLYNSLGKTKNSLLYTYQTQKAGLLSPARASLFFETAYDLHPLVRGDIFTLVNPDEGSVIYAPSLSWSVITNLDLYLIGFISKGSSNSEFSYFGKAFFLRTKYSF